ncbi:MAG: glutathione peroxidase [Alteromonadaceae bacterium]|jgi:glutathione peroxidase|nr:glutathione peroxidase [Alteromonadaceae bacterium]MBL6703802.1 glutathione peroxidase [Pseudomonadales bacterium]RPH11978.1 MAG: glutathione peroxidase [Alteromonadaceae bacterium TMED101]CAI8345833.1 MAG: Hydroperoxy fatty acid reductase gpx1 [Halieaceae bacterium]HCJ38400.1 glutathione peroxidase [Halieaceae bacterium]|tara:strand:+ start:314 stop:793 length:480 start_codon:yes stop_codon:yes gene_type:complete
MPSIFDYSATLSNGIDTPLSDYKGQVLLVVNTASRCGFTPQYEGLEKLYNEYKDSGFSVLAFPCNQFGAQEPGSTADIVDFCTTRFQTTFPLFEKIDVNGDNAHPLYKHLKSTVKGIMGTERIKWNFTKFLINREGEVVARYGSQKKPADIAKDISSLL